MKKYGSKKRTMKAPYQCIQVQKENRNWGLFLDRQSSKMLQQHIHCLQDRLCSQSTQEQFEHLPSEEIRMLRVMI